MDKIKVLSLFSGGLDSLIASRLMVDKGFDVTGLFIYTPFLSKKTHEETVNEIENIARQIPMRLIVQDVLFDYIDMLKSPLHGYGSQFNPCIDCKIYFLKKAKQLMLEIGASFIITGDVIYQRGMSQRLDALYLIEKEAELKGLVVRPLSLSFLRETTIEQQGILKRADFPSISGRGRDMQLNLLKQMHIKNYTQPAGGCLLTDPEYSTKIKTLIKFDKLNLISAELLKHGRLILKEGIYVAGRDMRDNKNIEILYSKHPIFTLLKPDFSGPTVALIEGTIKTAKNIVYAYSKVKFGKIDIRKPQEKYYED